MNVYILSTLFLSSYSYAAHENQYECGPHGRFEYCIDDIPGCIIGCHCHPGYYFDTDTKICEANIKLTQDFRRHYLSQPTRLQLSDLTPVPETTAPTTTTINPIDDKIDEITKDADDLGDWLYNQFFKTIENQVINNTNDDEQQLTRRSGSSPIKKKPTRKPPKYWKRSSKKKKAKNKKKGLKRKLLRITENDSLFDSSSSSGSEASSSSSSSESGGDMSSDNGKNDKDHGHKKIIIFNKKPKPALPSFIFLPNMDTPYYPPIGLNPPPAIPMYPMVPVPPVGSIFSAGLTLPNCDEKTSTMESIASSSGNTAATTAVTPTTTTAPASPVPPASPAEKSTAATQASPASPDPTPTTTSIATTPSTEENPSPGDMDSPDGNTPETTDPKPNKRTRGHSKHEKMLREKVKQNKFMQKLRERMKNLNKLSGVSPINQYQNLDDPFLDNSVAQDSFLYPKNRQPNPMDEDLPMEDVDFKYLSQLIHRANLNNTDNERLRAFSSKNRIENIPKPQSGRRNYNNIYDHNNNLPETSYVQRNERGRFSPQYNKQDDAYYTNIGRQIATMIRKIESDIGDREVDIEIENTNQRTPNHPVFSENSYAPRTYWERSVRSPLKKYFQPYTHEFEYLKNNNEKLFNLENKVEIAASTVPSLSLNEIENIINTMENVQANIQTQNNLKLPKHSKASFNINLMPESATEVNNEKNMAKTNYEPITKKCEKFHSHNNILTSNDGVGINSCLKLDPFRDTQIDKTIIYKSAPYSITRKRIPSMIEDSAIKTPLFASPLQYIRNLNSPIPKVSKKPSLPYELNPTVNHMKNHNYLTKNNNQYVYEKSLFPINFPSLSRRSNRPIESPMQPSYFHHELSHFDYFDE